MVWAYFLVASVVLWGLCGAVMAFGRRIWTLDTTLWVHLAAAPVFAFALASLHALAAPGFDPLLRAMAMTGLIILFDAAVVAPIFERSFAMFRSFLGTWLPFAAIFLGAWLAGVVFQP